MQRWWTLCVLAAATAFGCGPPGVDFGFPPGVPLPGGDAGSGSTDAGAPGTDGGSGSGLPCDVAQVFKTYCLSCHGNPTTNGAPNPLVTYADLQKKSLLDSTKTEAAESAALIVSTSNRMPYQEAPLSSANIAIIQNWVNAGAPSGTCHN